MNDDIGYMIKQLDTRLHAGADANLKECGLTFSQVRVLEVLRKNGGEASQKMIEETLGVAHPTVVGIVSRLEKNGFVSCYMDPADRRSKIVCETEKALENHRRHSKRMRETEACLVAGLSEEEIRELKRLLRYIYQNME